MATDFAPVFPGWNVWTVYQVKDLNDTNPLFWGLDRDRRLRIWVEDAIRLGAPGTTVADPADLKGGQIEILPSVPKDLATTARKEDVGGSSAMVVDGPADLRTVRFFNRGAKGQLVWPHDDNYLLNEVLTPSPTSPATSSAPPTTIGGTVAGGVGQVAKDAGLGTLLLGIAGLAGGIGLIYVAVKAARG